MTQDGHKKGKRKLVENLQWDVARKALQLGLNVVLENGFWSKKEREDYKELATAIGAQSKLHFLDVASEELKRRLTDRNKNLPANASYVNPDFIDFWVKEFEPPTVDELA